MYILLFLIFQVYKFESPLRNFNYTQNLNYFQTGQLNVPPNQIIYRNYIPVYVQSLPTNNRRLYVAPQLIPSPSISQNFIHLKHVSEQQIHQNHMSQQNIFNQPMYTQHMYNPQISDQQISQQHMPGQQIYQQHISQHNIYNQPIYYQYLYNPQISDQHIPHQNIHQMHMSGEKIHEPYIKETENNTLKSQLLDQKYHIYKINESDISQKLRTIRNMEKEKDKYPSNRNINQGLVSTWVIGREFIHRFIDVIEKFENFMKEQNYNAEDIFIKCIHNICLENPRYLYFKKNLLRKCCDVNQTRAISLCKIYTNQLSTIHNGIWEIIRQKYKDIQFKN